MNISSSDNHGDDYSTGLTGMINHEVEKVDPHVESYIDSTHRCTQTQSSMKAMTRMFL
jgi:hypothetical protein